jgi:hypothetical protein
VAELSLQGLLSHNALMTDLLEKAVSAVRSLPASTQDDIARVMLMLASEDQPPVPLTAEEEASLAESLAQASRGEFATDEQARAVWAKQGL